MGAKKSPTPSTFMLGAGHIPGDDLLSQDLSSHYHWRCSVSLPGSEWDRVVPPRSGHQRAILFDQDWDSGDLSFGLSICIELLAFLLVAFLLVAFLLPVFQHLLFLPAL